MPDAYLPDRATLGRLRRPEVARSGDKRARTSAEALVEVAPAPGLARLDAAHDRMGEVGEVLRRVIADRRVAAADVSAGEAQPQVHPGRAVAQAFLAALPRPRNRDPRSFAQVLALAFLLRRRDQLLVDAGLGVVDPIEDRLLEVDGGQGCAQHLVVDQPGVAGLQNALALGLEHLHAQPAVGGRRRL